jgi:ankyrin repeat protein
MFSEKGITALMRASKNQLPSIMEKLIQHGADVNRSDVDGDTPLHYLTMNLSDKNVGALNLLISSGASLEAKNNKGETPLLSAARWLNLSAVKLLLNAGSDKNARNAAGENVIQIFKNAGDYQSVDELLALGLENAPATVIQE